jgi:GNAT superfamily N-acetyltransferase
MDYLRLRKATPDDIDLAYQIRKAAFKEYVEKVQTWDDHEQQQLHKQRYGVQDFHVINHAGIDVGIMAVVVSTDCVKVNQLFLLPEYQGKGIGSECMLLIMEEARQLGLPVQLRVMKVNPRAMVFYLRLGFNRTSETDTHVQMEKRS